MDDSRESPDNGGLGFTAAEIGTILIVLGAVGITYNLFFFKPISKRVGVMVSERMTAASLY